MTKKIPEEVLYQAKLIVARTKFWTPAVEKLLRRWKRQIGQRYVGHKECEQYYKRWYLGIGIPMVILTAVVSAGILTTFKNCDSCGNSNNPNNTIPGVDPCAQDVSIRIAMGVLAGLSAALSAIFIFLDFGGQNKEHKDAASDCGSLEREVDELINTEIVQRGDPSASLQKIRNKFDQIVKNSPSVPETYSCNLDYISYEKGHHYNHSKVVQPPSSALDLNKLKRKGKNVPDVSVLTDILIADVKKAKEEKKQMKEDIEKANEYDTDEDKEVTIPFDLDSIRPGDLLEDHGKRAVRESLERALMFEMTRFDTSHVGVDKFVLTGSSEKNDDHVVEFDPDDKSMKDKGDYEYTEEMKEVDVDQGMGKNNIFSNIDI